MWRYCLILFPIVAAIDSLGGTSYTEDEAKSVLKKHGIIMASNNSIDGMRSAFLDILIKLKYESNCPIVIVDRAVGRQGLRYDWRQFSIRMNNCLYAYIKTCMLVQEKKNGEMVYNCNSSLFSFKKKKRRRG